MVKINKELLENNSNYITRDEAINLGYIEKSKLVLDNRDNKVKRVLTSEFHNNQEYYEKVPGHLRRINKK